MIANWEKEPEKAQRLHNFLVVAEGIVKQDYPASAKQYLQHSYGFPISNKCRNGSTYKTDIPENFQKLEALHAMMLSMCEELGIKPTAPVAPEGQTEPKKGAGAAPPAAPGPNASCVA
jgi:hypothetical protein